ncbi:MAG: hypothetical protein U0R64_09520 [Candidatus Nanopelagicales bacterium]
MKIRTAVAATAVSLLAITGAAPAFAAPAPAGSSPAHVVAAYPSEWSSPNGDWVISSVHRAGDTTLQMGTWSHRGTVRVKVTGPDKRPATHDFRLVESPAMEGWYQFSDSWRAHYPDQGKGQYTVVFMTKSGGKWQNICDRTLGFVVR